MKNLVIFFLLSTTVLAFGQQQKDESRIPLIGEAAPAFEANSTNGSIKFPDDYFSKWKILFSHPADFTPVCTSEILELAAMQDEFDKLNAAILVISTDGLNSHIEWVRSIEALTYNDKKTSKIKFPLISDAGLEISKKYGMLHSASHDTRDIRGVFIIDPDNTIQAMFFYPATVGRNLEEIKRTLLALQTHDKYNVLTPANWKPGGEVLIPSPASIKEAEKLKEKNDPSLRQIEWYMWFKKL
jgi:peroxiredoxin (alkyl hydroperoxide reductase subunit C)